MPIPIPDDMGRLRSNLSSLTDEALVHEYLLGSDAYSSPAAWELVEREFRSRGAPVIEIRNRLVSARSTELGVSARRAKFGVRLSSIVIDWAALSLVVIVLTTVAGDDLGPLIAALLILPYHPVCELLFGATIGKAVLHLKVTMRDGTPLTLRSALLRAISRPLVGGLIWIAILGTPWVHDIASRTVVIHSHSAPTSM